MRVVSEHGHGNVHPVQGDAQALPFEDGTFGAVVLIGVLGEIRDAEAALRETARVLEPGTGRLVVGESLIAPDCVMFNVLQRTAAGSGLSLQSRQGPVIGYYARFAPAPPPAVPA